MNVLVLDKPPRVAPYTGAWIEILVPPYPSLRLSSHPTRVRGLKFISIALFKGSDFVAPYTGAWIEIDSNLE